MTLILARDPSDDSSLRLLSKLRVPQGKGLPTRDSNLGAMQERSFKCHCANAPIPLHHRDAPVKRPWIAYTVIGGSLRGGHHRWEYVGVVVSRLCVVRYKRVLLGICTLLTNESVNSAARYI